jgi:TolB-like protein/DNA-binding winged helix-turn-helix (wHTH) protein/predicted Zn-dependent protease
MSDPGQSFRFDRYTLETARGVLLGPDGEIPLRPKSYQVLLYLVTHPGRLVGRQELLDAVWGKTVITDDSLTQCLVEIRRALGDEARKTVRTVPRRGYLFDVPVAPLKPHREPPATRGRDGRDQAATRTAARQPSLRVLAVTGLVLLALALVWLGTGREAAPPPPESTAAVPLAPNGIAVLPFVDMSGTGDQGYLGDGIAEEILNTLAQSRDLRVIARTSSFSFRDRPVDIRTIAGQLGVSYVLEGSVRRSGNRVRIVAQLIDARDGAHRWSESFERELDEIFVVQDEIAGEVAKALQALLSSPPTGPAIRDVKAYEHFLRGRFLFHRRADGDVERARQHFETAVELDPDYAAAWAALAGAYAVQFDSNNPAEEPGFEPAREAAARALALDPSSVEGHLRTASLLFMAGDEAGMRRHWEIAETLDPENPLLLGFQAGLALRYGDHAAAVERQQRAVQRDPMSPLNRLNLAFMLLAAGRPDEARTQVLAVRELTPERPEIDLVLASALILEQRFAEAAAFLDDLPEDSDGEAVLAIVTHALGQDADHQAAIARLRGRDTAPAATALAEVHAQRGDVEGAWQWLEESRRRIPPDAGAEFDWLQQTSSSAFLGPLHDDPRWAALFDDDSARISAKND